MQLIEYYYQTGGCAMKCPKCGSVNIDVQVFQEDRGSITTSKTKSKYKEAGHGCLWWLLIGWWWWIVDLILWICFFFPRLLVKLFSKKKYKGKSKTVSTTVNNIGYRHVYTCKECGNTWHSKS